MRHAFTAAVDVFSALLADERGQDLIEYALLTSAVGLAGVATWPGIAEAIGAAYLRLNQKADALWVPLPPGGGP